MFVAHYSKAKLLGLAAIGLVFAAVGAMMIAEPNGAFDHSGKIVAIGFLLGGNNDLAGHGIGYAAAILGLGVLPVIGKMMLHGEPAMRIDDSGIYWHRWSAKPIGWSNVVKIDEKFIRRQRFVSLTLRDPSLDPSRGLLRQLGGLNRMMGFGHVSLTAQGTDKSHAELLEAVLLHAERHAQGRPAPARERAQRPEAVSIRAFGRKRL